jgi:hypothetical protein
MVGLKVVLKVFQLVVQLVFQMVGWKDALMAFRWVVQSVLQKVALLDL